LLRQVVDLLEIIRGKLRGHLYFIFSTEGVPLQVTANDRVIDGVLHSENTETDLFYAKGLMAAAHYLGDSALLATTDEFFRSVVLDALGDLLLNDRQPMDHKNHVMPVAGRITRGPKMLALGGIATGITLNLGQEY